MLLCYCWDILYRNLLANPRALFQISDIVLPPDSRMVIRSRMLRNRCNPPVEHLTLIANSIEVLTEIIIPATVPGKLASSSGTIALCFI